MMKARQTTASRLGIGFRSQRWGSSNIEQAHSALTNRTEKYFDLLAQLNASVYYEQKAKLKTVQDNIKILVKEYNQLGLAQYLKNLSSIL